MKPVLIDSQFLSTDECNHIFKTLLKYRDKWFHIKDSDMPLTDTVDLNKHFANFFGPSVYCLSKSPDKYINLKTEYNDILSSEFSDFYVRIKDKITETLGIPAYYCDDISYPGFHIFGPGLEEPVTYDYFHYHQDLYPESFKNIIPYSEIYSFIIPIKLPDSGASLEYNKGETYKYAEGSISYWHGNMPHKIADFQLKGAEDYRITWQMHVAVLKEIAIIFW